MARIEFTPASLGREIESLQRKLHCAPRTLSNAHEVALGACEREAVLRLEKVVLYRYKPRSAVENRIPVLIVYALVNRPDMLDLQADRSLIQALLERGLDIYLIDWGYPDGSDQTLGLDDYICRYLHACVSHVMDASGRGGVNLLGVCQGGTFSICYGALYPERVANLITTVTPVDFHTRADLLSHLFRYVDISALADAGGNIPGDLLNMVFLALKPFRLGQQKYVHMLDSLDDEYATNLFMRMEKWIFDSPALAATAFREFADMFYQRNALVNGAVSIGGRDVRLSNLGMPILNIYAEQDHLVPPDSSLALSKYVSSDDYEALALPGGHIGLYVSSAAHKILPDSIESWLRARD